MDEDPFELMERRMARLERQLSEMIQEAFHPSWDLARKALEPLWHLEESDSDFILTVDLPGVRDKKDLEVECTENSVQLRARMQNPITFGRWGTVQRNACFECYRKTVTLPSPVDPERAQADFKGGLLTLRLPKLARRHKIRVL